MTSIRVHNEIDIKSRTNTSFGLNQGKENHALESIKNVFQRVSVHDPKAQLKNGEEPRTGTTGDCDRGPRGMKSSSSLASQFSEISLLMPRSLACRRIGLINSLDLLKTEKHKQITIHNIFDLQLCVNNIDVPL